MARISLIGIFLGVVLLVIAIPHIDTIRTNIVTAAVDAPIPAIFAILLVLASLAAVVSLVLALANQN